MRRISFDEYGQVRLLLLIVCPHYLSVRCSQSNSLFAHFLFKISDTAVPVRSRWHGGLSLPQTIEKRVCSEQKRASPLAMPFRYYVNEIFCSDQTDGGTFYCKEAKVQRGKEKRLPPASCLFAPLQ